MTPSARNNLRVVVTGAAGYIGSHTVLELARRGYEVTGIDNFSNSSRKLTSRLAELTPAAVRWLEIDIRDSVAMDSAFEELKPDAVVHFAGLKSVEQSCRDPLPYYSVNVSGTTQLLQVMLRHRVPRLIFSSSATVYDATQASPVAENSPLACASPYGRTKMVAEQLIADTARASGFLKYVLLRYFNPVGADPSGRIGECPTAPPANLMPMICRVASGAEELLTVFGADYPTRDGTGVRDFVHVADVARAHVLALEALDQDARALTLNIGSGCGFSVLETLRAFARATAIEVPYRIAARRPGDVAELYADASLADTVLGWRAEHDLETMCRDAWRWQLANPEGYGP